MLLAIDGVSKQFVGVRALNNVSFSLGSGELVGLIGPNGSGKTTLFNVVSGFIKPTAGKITFDNEDITGTASYRIARRGLVRTWQSNLIVSDETVARNIQLFQIGSGKAEADLLSVEAIAESLKLQDFLDRQARGCPHGVQRKLSIAMGLAASPKLLMLDEPLAGLNAQEVEGAIQAIRSVCETFGTTVLWVEHNMAAIMSTCSRVIVLSYGNFLADGSPHEIQQNPKVIEAYLGEE